MTERIARRVAVAALTLASAITVYAALDAIHAPITASPAAEARNILPPASAWGPILNPGTADAAVIVDGHVLQIEYLPCLPALRAGTAVLWEDGSAAIINPDGSISPCN